MGMPFSSILRRADRRRTPGNRTKDDFSSDIVRLALLLKDTLEQMKQHVVLLHAIALSGIR